MKGPIAWMAENHVASNILMLVFLLGGLLIGRNVKQEVFPELAADIVSVSIIYPGASPEEVEEGVVKPIENSISGLDNIKRITATAGENVGTVMLEVLEGGNVDEVLNDVKSEVDRIRTFPEEAEKPVISKVTGRREVLTLVVYGNASERALVEHAERVRDDLIAMPNITQVSVESARPYEISVEISEENLRKYNLTLSQVAGIIRRASLDLAGGSIKTDGGEILIRTSEKRYKGFAYDSVAVFAHPNGSRVLLKDIADVKDEFADVDQIVLFDDVPAVVVKVYRVGDQTPKLVSKTVNEYIKLRNIELPPSVQIAIWEDYSIILNQRLNLLLRNGFLGLMLVLITLSLFLEIRLAMWVALGIFVAFMGSLMFMPMFDASINMISLFAFIIILGVVVDDAIVVGENIFVYYRSGETLQNAAKKGAIEVAPAVVFAGLTTFCAFGPLLFVSGTMGKIMFLIPVIVISVLFVSLVESLFVLPSHLANRFNSSKAFIWTYIESKRAHFDKLIEWLINNTYVNTLKWVMNHRYEALAIALAIQLMTIGFIRGGHIKFIFMPEVEADEVIAKLELEPGSAFEETAVVTEYIQRQGELVITEFDDEQDDGESALKHVYTMIGSQLAGRGPHSEGATFATNIAEVHLRLVDPDERDVSATEVARKWQKAVGEIAGVDKLTFSYELMRMGSDIDIQLSHNDYEMLERATVRLKMELERYAGVKEVTDSYSEGKRELKLQLKPEAASLGVSEFDLASQVRSAFYGAEALRLQRGKNEVKVMVRYPKEDRRSMSTIDNMRIRTVQGGEIPFYQAAYVEEGHAFNIIRRTDRQRVVNVTARVDKKVANSGEVLNDLKEGTLAQMAVDFPGLSFDFEGQSRDQRESMSSMMVGFAFALFLIYALLAVLFGSYLQPVAVMSAIPFGVVGAVIGHILLGYNLSMISMFGIVALSGVVVNSSLMLIVFINRRREKGAPLKEAILQAGKRRFRPIIMTSLTTFFGLTPMILETSMQARFLIPMAISLGFGVLFSTAITLALVPALYMIIEDINGIFFKDDVTSRDEEEVEAEVMSKSL